MRFDDTAQLVGSSEAICDLRLKVDRAARTDSNVLITGERGSGTEVVARQIYAASARADRDFIHADCGGVPETLLLSELFGHVRGSFRGAYRDKAGKLETADGSTMFLDDVGELTLRVQGRILRFLETGNLERVGADRQTASVNVRTIASTSRNLDGLVSLGLFREDLLNRLNVIDMRVPPLRARRQDVAELVDHFLARLRELDGRVRGGITPETVAALAAHSWPGNIRELENVVKRMVDHAGSRVIAIEDVPPEIRPANTADDLYKRMVEGHQSFWETVHPLFINGEITRDCVREIVRRGLQDAQGNYAVVARIFNMDARSDCVRFLDFLRNHDCQPSFEDPR